MDKNNQPLDEHERQLASGAPALSALLGLILDLRNKAELNRVAGSQGVFRQIASGKPDYTASAYRLVVNMSNSLGEIAAQGGIQVSSKENLLFVRWSRPRSGRQDRQRIAHAQALTFPFEPDVDRTVQLCKENCLRPFTLRELVCFASALPSVIKSEVFWTVQKVRLDWLIRKLRLPSAIKPRKHSRVIRVQHCVYRDDKGQLHLDLGNPRALAKKARLSADPFPQMPHFLAALDAVPTATSPSSVPPSAL